MMDFDWIQFFISAPLHLLLAWVIVMPTWGAWVITGFAIFELIIGAVFLALDVKQHKEWCRRNRGN